MAFGFSDAVRSRFLGGGFLGWKRNGEEEDGPPRRLKPSAISIRWNPVALSDRELDEDHARDHELFIAQAALRQARGHLSGSGEEFGFLLGRHYRCRETDAPWIHIAEALPASGKFPAGGETDRFRLACVGAKTQAANRGLEVVGWYHEHRYLGPTFTDGDRQLHDDSFPAPWQCALVFVTGGTRMAGAFIQPWRGERYYQRAQVSFREVLEDDGGADDDVRSCIDWSNYVPERPVSLLPPEERAPSPPLADPAPPRRSQEVPPSVEAPEPRRGGGDPNGEPAGPARPAEAPAPPPWLQQFEATRREVSPAARNRPAEPPDPLPAGGEPPAFGASEEPPEPEAWEEPPASRSGKAPAVEAPARESAAVGAGAPRPAPRRLPIDEEFGLLLPTDEEPRRRGGALRAALRRILPGG